LTRSRSFLREFQLNEVLPVQKQRRLMVRGPVVTADVTAKTVNVRYEIRPPGGVRGGLQDQAALLLVQAALLQSPY